jgi:hypothetical protein
VLTALVPTLIAQTFFQPGSHDLHWGRRRQPEEATEPVLPHD